MLGIFRSLRFKLVATFVAIFAVIQLALGTTALVARERYLRHEFDAQLTRRTQNLAAELLRTDDPFARRSLVRAVDLERASLARQDIYVQVVSATGAVLERSDNLRAHRLPFDMATAPRDRSGAGAMETLAADPADATAVRREPLRMITLFIDVPDAAPFYLQAAMSLAEVRESIAFVRALFYIAIPAGLVTAAIASWVAAGNAMRRINEVASLAHELRPGNLDDRLAPAGTRDELGQMVDELNHALDRLETGFRAQERFLHDASHELKTPVSVLLSEAQVLRLADPDKGAYRQFVASVEEETGRLGKLVESLLLLTREDGRNAVAHGGPTAINDIVMAAIEQCDTMARQRGVTLTPRLHLAEGDGQELRCLGDVELLVTVVSNLLRNAIRFSPADGWVAVTVWREASEGVMQVRDQGPGIAVGEEERIFDRFFRGSNNAARAGSGLGLTIARSIVEVHHGRVTVSNLAGGGCAFEVRLPLASQAAAADRAWAGPGGAGAA